MTEQRRNTDTLPLESAGRRKAVKTIVSGIATMAAYNLLPARWDRPIVESVFLPVHAATSGLTVNPCSTEYTGLDGFGNYTWTATFSVSPPVAGVALNIRRIVHATDTTHDFTFQLTTSDDGSIAFDDSFEQAFFIDLQYIVTLVDGNGQASCSWSGPT